MSVGLLRWSCRLLCSQFLVASMVLADAFSNKLLASVLSQGHSTPQHADRSLFSTTTELRFTESTSVLRGKLGWNPAPGHHLYFVGQKTANDQSPGVSKYGVGYNWIILNRHKIFFRSMNSETRAGIKRADYGVGYNYRIPIRVLQSSLRIGYRATEDVQTFLELSYSVSKSLRKSTGLPVTVSATSRWQRRETDGGLLVDSTGGNVGLKLQLNPSFGLEAGHNVSNKTSAANTNVIASYRATFSGNLISIKVGLNSNKTASFSLQTGI